MGLKLKPGEVRNQTSSMIQSLQNDNESLKGILPSIDSFVSESSLKGQAWTGVKNQLNGHKTVIQGLICANEQVIADCHTLAGAVGGEDLDEDELEERIASRKRENITFAKIRQNNQNSMNRLPASMPLRSYNSMSSYYINEMANMTNLINTNNAYIAELEQKLKTLRQIESSTSGLFQSGTSNTVGTGITALNGSWTGSGFSIPASTPWMKDINKERKDFKAEKKLLKKGMTQEQIDYMKGFGYTPAQINTYWDSIKNNKEELKKFKAQLDRLPELAAKTGENFAEEMGLNLFSEGLEEFFEKNTGRIATKLWNAGSKHVVGSVVGSTESSIYYAGSKVTGALGKYSPVIGAAVDLGSQLKSGENLDDAVWKTGAHTIIGMTVSASGVGASVGAKAGAIVGTAFGGPIGTVVGAAVGTLAGVAITTVGSMAFDFAYDNKEKIAKAVGKGAKKAAKKVKQAAENVGDAVSGFFNGLGTAFG